MKGNKKVIELPGSNNGKPRPEVEEGHETPGPEAEKKPISNPAKEFPMDQADVMDGTKCEQLQMVIGTNMVKLAQMRRRYLLAEQSIMDRVKMCESDVNSIINNLKVKHKIIGEIEGFDLKEKKIVIK